MKKLMIAAAAAAMVGGAFADECTTPCAWGYKLKVIVKTTTAEKVENAALCQSGCYRKPAIRRYIGYFFGSSDAQAGTCGTSTCGCFDTGTVKGRLAMWNFDTKEAVTPDTTKMILMNRIGKDDTRRAEIVFATTYTKYETETALTFAGFAQCDKLASGMKAIKTASGYCAGTVPGACFACEEECGTIKADTCQVTAATVWNLCDKEGGSLKTAAFGKWAMQWDAEMADRVYNNKTTITDEGADNFTPAGYKAGVAGVINYDDLHFIEVNAD